MPIMHKHTSSAGTVQPKGSEALPNVLRCMDRQSGAAASHR